MNHFLKMFLDAIYECFHCSITRNIPVLPDGLFSNQKCQFWYILEFLAKKQVGKFYGHFVYFTALWYIL
jgi:hypothetical protein